ncbi:MAG: hypothetical protein QM811_08795 [Pirellulales bacterium]
MAGRRSSLRSVLLSSICLLPTVAVAQQAPSVMRNPPPAARPMPRPAPQQGQGFHGAAPQTSPGTRQPTLAPPQPGANAGRGRKAGRAGQHRADAAQRRRR